MPAVAPVLATRRPVSVSQRSSCHPFFIPYNLLSQVQNLIDETLQRLFSCFLDTGSLVACRICSHISARLHSDTLIRRVDARCQLTRVDLLVGPSACFTLIWIRAGTSHEGGSSPTSEQVRSHLISFGLSSEPILAVLARTLRSASNPFLFSSIFLSISSSPSMDWVTSAIRRAF